MIYRRPVIFLFLLILTTVVWQREAGAAQLLLHWSDNSTNENGFEIERRTTTSAFTKIASVGSNVNTYADLGLANATMYCYRVRAFNSNGTSSYSSEVCATTPTSTATLTVTRVGNGTVTSSPAGINCPTDCSEAYVTGTIVTLSAIPSLGSVFSGWSGGGCNGAGSCIFNVNVATTVTATFSNTSTTSTPTVNSITPSSINLATPPASFTIAGGSFANSGFGLPIVNFTRSGTVLGQARATALTGSTSLTVSFPTNATSLIGSLPGLSAGTVSVDVYNQTGPGTYSLPGSILLTVNSPSATLSATPSSVTAGGNLTTTWSGIVSPTAADWIGLYVPGAADSAFITWVYVSCSKLPSGAFASGSCPFQIPASLAAGTYELRMFANNTSQVRLGRSNSFTVQAAPPPILSATPSSVTAGGNLTTTWSGIVSPTAADWIGLYVPGAADSAFITWVYVSCSKLPSGAFASGSCPFQIPASLVVGTYELRFFSNNGFLRLARSNAITIN
jgi:hypothetical protein